MEFFNHIHSKYSGIRGFMTVYRDALRYRYMVTDIALRRARILAFWEKHGIAVTIEAFGVKRRTLYEWRRRFTTGGKVPETLNQRSRAPKRRRRRLWSPDIIAEVKRLRWAHPNLGKEKLYPLLLAFCMGRGLDCPKPKTIGRLIQDLGGLRIFPEKVRHDGRVVQIKKRVVLRKPKGFHVEYPGHLVALDTVERFVHGLRRYIITFEDVYTRFGFAWATTSHASLAAREFFGYCRTAFPFPMAFVLTDNGSEFMKHFADELKRLHLVHYHTYPKTPKMNAHVERFNRTIQEEFVDYHAGLLLDPPAFNRMLMDWLVFYNTERVHGAFRNKLSPVQFMLSLDPATLPEECRSGWPHTEP